jgi:hypothetical protein
MFNIYHTLLSGDELEIPNACNILPSEKIMFDGEF